MYTAFPETILDTESNSCASTRFDSEPLRIADAYFVMEFVNAFDGEVVLSVVAVAELFFWYRYDDMFCSLLLLLLLLLVFNAVSVASRGASVALSSLSSLVTLGKTFSNFRSSFLHFSTRRAEICAALSSSSSLARPLLLPRFLLLLLHDDEEMATTATAAFIFFVPRL